ncbi:MAG: ABC transporter substrate-binding protein [Duodenibacillus sp.]|nr:ABC transporter substrate-binding protein [Duodenibacillus sp.]
MKRLRPALRALAALAALAASLQAQAGVPLFLDAASLPPGARAAADAVAGALSRRLDDAGVEVVEVDERGLQRALERGGQAFFITSSASFRQKERPLGARALAWLVPEGAEDPARTTGALVLARRAGGIRSFSDLKGKRLAYAEGGAGLDAVLGQAPSPGWFSQLSAVPGGAGPLLEALDAGRADAVALPVCRLEREGAGPRAVHYRAVSPAARAAIGCLHTTELYPGPVLGATGAVDAGLALKAAAAAYGAPAREGFYWSMPGDFSRVDALLKKLGKDDYAWLQRNAWLRLWRENKPWFAAGAALLAMLVAHSFILNGLVRRRTAQLSRLIEEKEALRRSEQSNRDRLEQLQKVGIVGLMSSMFAHEIRQPLSSIQCWSFALRGMVERGAAKDELLKTIASIADQAGRADGVVERIRAYARGRRRDPAPVDLGAAARAAAESVRSATGQAVSIEIEGPSSAPAALADPFEVELALVNLLRNAAEAQKGLRKPWVRVALRSGGGRAGVTVTDGGPPVDDALIARLAAPFVTTKEGGMGLGLAVVRSIAVRNGGSLVLKKSPAGGMQAELALPAAQGDAPCPS